jgi:hypothetical protein
MLAVEDKINKFAESMSPLHLIIAMRVLTVSRWSDIQFILRKG